MDYRKTKRNQGRKNFDKDLYDRITNPQFLAKTDFITQFKKQLHMVQKKQGIEPLKSCTVTNEGIRIFVERELKYILNYIRKNTTQRLQEFPLTSETIKRRLQADLKREDQQERMLSTQEQEELDTLCKQLNNSELNSIFIKRMKKLLDPIFIDKSRSLLSNDPLHMQLFNALGDDSYVAPSPRIQGGRKGTDVGNSNTGFEQLNIKQPVRDNCTPDNKKTQSSMFIRRQTTDMSPDGTTTGNGSQVNLTKVIPYQDESDDNMSSTRETKRQNNTEERKTFEPHKLVGSKELPSKEVSDDCTSENQSDAPTNIELVKHISDNSLSRKGMFSFSENLDDTNVQEFSSKHVYNQKIHGYQTVALVQTTATPKCFSKHAEQQQTFEQTMSQPQEEDEAPIFNLDVQVNLPKDPYASLYSNPTIN